MAKRADRQHTPAAIQRILDYLDWAQGPALVGFVSMGIGYSLKQTEEMLDVLEARGDVRRLTSTEVKHLGIDERCLMCERVRR